MNISNISIHTKDGRMPQISKEDSEIISYVNNPNRKSTVNRQTNKPSGDIFVSSNKSDKKSDKVKKEVAKALAAYALGALTVTGIMLPKVSNNKNSDTSYLIPVTVSTSTTYETLAKLYDSDPRAILAYNRELYSEGVAAGQKLDIPRLYSNLDSEITSLQNQLINDNPDTQSRKELEILLAKLMKKKNLQEEIALTFTDGKYVYFIVNNLDEANSEQLGRIKTKNGIPVEIFEQIFDISEPDHKVTKPEITKTNNNFSYMYESISQYVGSDAMFYVPIEAIATGHNISIKY